MRPAPRGPTPTRFRGGSPASRTARPCWSSSAGAGRLWAWCSDRRARPRRADVRPILARVRADGPLLPRLTLDFARWISEEYLAPPAATLRSMLPPGCSSGWSWWPSGRRRTPGGLRRPGPPGIATRSRARWIAWPPGRDRSATWRVPDGRAATLRRLRSMAARGSVRLEWTLTAASAGPRFERWLTLTRRGGGGRAEWRRGRREAGQADRPPGWGRASGPCWRTWSRPGRPVPGAGGGRGRSAPRVGDRHGTHPARPGRGRDPGTAAPAAGAAAGRPAGDPARGLGSDPAAGEALATILAAAEAGDPTPLLLEGITGSGKTAVYAEAIAETISAGRPALVLVPEIALAMPLVDRLRADLDAEIAILHSGARRRGAGRRVAAHPGRRGRRGRGDAHGIDRAARRDRADRRGRGARRRLQERSHAAAPGPRCRAGPGPPRRGGPGPRKRDALG